MTLDAAKEKLHDIIDHADEEKVFELLLLVENSSDEKHVYDEEVLDMLRERSSQYLSGAVKTYTVEESMERMKIHRQRNGI